MQSYAQSAPTFAINLFIVSRTAVSPKITMDAGVRRPGVRNSKGPLEEKNLICISELPAFLLTTLRNANKVFNTPSVIRVKKHTVNVLSCIRVLSLSLAFSLRGMEEGIVTKNDRLRIVETLKSSYLHFFDGDV